MAKLYKQGHSLVTIGQMAGVSPETVRMALVRAGIRRRPPHRAYILSESEQKKVCKLYQKGLVMRVIAERFDSSIRNIHRILTKHNVPRRKAGRPIGS